MRLFQRAFALRSWRWGAALAVVWGGMAGCGGGAAPQVPEEGLQLFAGLPRSAVPQSGARGGIRTPVTMDAQGNLYGPFDCTIRKVSPDGAVTTVARLTPDGSCILGNGKFVFIDGIAIDAAGSFYIADGFNRVIRKIAPDGVVSVLAGAEGAFGGAEDGTGTAARFIDPRALAVDAAGTVYVADVDAVRRISPEGSVTTLRVDLPVTDASAQSASISPLGMAVDAAGVVYTMDTLSQRLVKIPRDGAASVLAGSTRAAGAGQTRDGPGDQARFFRVEALALDAQGNVVVADDTTLRKVTPAGVVSTLAGRPGLSDSVDGRAGAARFQGLFAVAVEPRSGRILVFDAGIGFRTVTPDGNVATPGGRSSTGSTDGPGTQARFGTPQGVAVDAQGNVHVADHANGTIRKVSAAGVVSTFVGTAALRSGPGDGVGPGAHLFFPTGLTFDTAGNLYVAEAGVGFNSGFDAGAVRRVTPQAATSVVFDSEVVGTGIDLLCGLADVPVNDVAADASGTVYFVHPARPIVCKFTPQGSFVLVAGEPGETGSADGPARDARFKAPTHLVFDAAGNLYVSDAANHTVRRISPQGVVSTVAGLAGQAGSADGVGAAARFSTPGDLAVAPDGSVYVADIGNRAVRRLAPDGAVSTFIRAEGAATMAEPTALAIGPGGRLLYIADGPENVLWRARLP